MIKLFFEGLNMGVLVTDRATNVVVWCSKVAERQLGYSAAEMLGRDSSFLYADPDAHRAMVQRGSEVLAEVGVFRSEMLMRRKDGSTFDSEQSINVMVDPTRLQLAIRDISERKEAVRQLAQSRDELRRLSARLETLREEERARIARSLQEELGQDITAVTLNLTILRDRLDSEHHHDVDVLIEHTRRTVDRLQEVCAELRPALLDHLGLLAALEWTAADFEKRSGMRCEVDLDATLESLRDPHAIALLRIAQEALSNVRRHAGAHLARVRLASDADGSIALTIDDDGAGIAPQALEAPESLGLVAIRERARALGGRAEIRRRSAGGTTVEVRVPPPLPAP